MPSLAFENSQAATKITKIDETPSIPLRNRSYFASDRQFRGIARSLTITANEQARQHLSAETHSCSGVYRMHWFRPRWPIQRERVIVVVSANLFAVSNRREPALLPADSADPSLSTRRILSPSAGRSISCRDLLRGNPCFWQDSHSVSKGLAQRRTSLSLFGILSCTRACLE